jgi:hypothetical protein
MTLYILNKVLYFLSQQATRILILRPLELVIAWSIAHDEMF